MTRSSRHRARACGLALLLSAFVLGASDVAPGDGHEASLPQCLTCHGAHGHPSDPSIPIIAGQEFYYLYVQLKDYKAGRRANPVMGAIVAQMDKPEMQALAKHFSEQKWPAQQVVVDDATSRKAEQAATAGQCVQCHLGGYEGDSRVPRLAGQQVAYLERTMLDFKNKVRLNSPAKGSLLNAFSDEDIAAMAQYLGAM